MNVQYFSVCFPSFEQPQHTLDPTQRQADGTVILHLAKFSSLVVERVWENLVLFMW